MADKNEKLNATNQATPAEIGERIAREQAAAAMRDEEMGRLGNEAFDLLERIREKVEDLPAPQTNGLNWGHVGALHNTVAGLRQIAEVLDA